MTNREDILVIKTRDKSLGSDLTNLRIENLKIYKKTFTCDSAEWVPPVQEMLTFIVDASTNIEISLFATWLYERVRKTPTDETTIEDNDIVKSPEQINIILINKFKSIKKKRKKKK